MAFICAQCGESIERSADGRRCPECGHPPVLDGRYRLVDKLGHGAAGVTYRGRRLEDDRRVAVKQLSYQAMDSLETQKLFEREARVLRQLDHPGIPAYLDDFSVESRDRFRLYLVQEYVDGETLASELERRRYDEREILGILEELADILAYLQDRRPPVIHRDIKPTNVMRREDGRLVLIDFGSVKATTDGAVGGSTIAGTFGYMAPEQHWGKATPQTDVYGLGALGLALVSRRDPEEFVDPTSRKLSWRNEVEASEPFAELLGGLLEREPEDRPADAETAREAIRRTRDRLSGDSEPVTSRRPSEQARSEQKPPEREASGSDATPERRSRPPSTGVVIAVLIFLAGVIVLGNLC